MASYRGVNYLLFNSSINNGFHDFEYFLKKNMSNLLNFDRFLKILL